MAENRAKLKIGLVLDDGLDVPDGVQQYILSVGEWLISRGHDARYLVGYTARTDLPHVHSLSRNLKVRSNGNRMSIPLPTSRSKLRKFLKREQFDVLHVQTPFSPFMGGQLVTLADERTAVVGTFHILPNSAWITVGTYALGLWSYRALKRFDTMLSVSPAAAQFARRTFRVNSQISPNVIDYSRFHDAKPLKKYDDGVLTILFLGRLVPRKGSQTLIEAVAELVGRKDLPKFRVVICGKGPLEANLREAIEFHKLDGLVELTGFVTEADKPRYYASADIAVFPSSAGESFGIVLPEAMASGNAAVLAGDNPGYRSVMEPQPDLLFAPRNPVLLAEKLAKYLKDSERRQEMAAWGTDYARRFDVETVGRKLVAIYEAALQNRRQL